MVDYPGHDRLRGHLNHFLPIAGAIVFVVDSVNLPKEIQNAAGFLYTLLTSTRIVENTTPIIVFCNKSDLETAKSVEFIKTELEVELYVVVRALFSLRKRSTKQRQTRRQMIDANEVFLGLESKDFTFDDAPVEVRFCRGSVLAGNIAELSGAVSGILQ